MCTLRHVGMFCASDLIFLKNMQTSISASSKIFNYIWPIKTEIKIRPKTFSVESNNTKFHRRK
jgi:hypothetical protein